MTTQEKEAILSIAMLASFADRARDEAEHASIRRIAEGFQMDAMDIGAAYQKVLTQQITLASAAAVLTSPEGKSLAYEIARAVCEANGPALPEEQAFLDSLSAALKSASAASTPGGSAVLVPPVPDAASDLEPVLLKYAILTAALELLPQKAGSLAIVPIQMKMVYDIGRRHGVTLDRGSLRDFGAALGIGAVSQVLEGGLRTVLSGVFGGIRGGVTSGVAGTAMTFATTYALGTVAERYYASGRKMDMTMLKEEFTKLLETAQSKGTEYSDDITAKATELTTRFQGMDFSKVLGGLLSGIRNAATK